MRGGDMRHERETSPTRGQGWGGGRGLTREGVWGKKVGNMARLGRHTHCRQVLKSKARVQQV